MNNTFRAIALSVVIIQITGCAAVIRPVRDAIDPPGEMNSDGSINPCHGYRSNHQACGDAIYNGKRIGNVQIGQSLVEVKSIMGRGPEKRSVEAKEGRTFETWSFLTDYDRSITTQIDFLESKVSAIKQITD